MTKTAVWCSPKCVYGKVLLKRTVQVFVVRSSHAVCVVAPSPNKVNFPLDLPFGKKTHLADFLDLDVDWVRAALFETRLQQLLWIQDCLCVFLHIQVKKLSSWPLLRIVDILPETTEVVPNVEGEWAQLFPFAWRSTVKTFLTILTLCAHVCVVRRYIFVTFGARDNH